MPRLASRVTIGSHNAMRRALICHDRPPRGLNGVSVTLTRSGNRLDLLYEFHAEAGALFIPPPMPFMPADDLWQSTCAELFIGDRAGPGYTEYNFSPSGAYASYRFSDYRQRSGIGPAPLALEMHTTDGTLKLTATVSLDEKTDWPLGLNAVLARPAGDRSSGDRSYWALHHPCFQPDFHDARGWFPLSKLLT